MSSEPSLGILSISPDATREIGRCCGSVCRGGEVFLLTGGLGSGKTCFTQGLAVGLGVDPAVSVTSPTFTLHAQYEGRLLLNHVDVYRLEENADSLAMDLEEMFCEPRGVTVVEWAELLGASAPAEHMQIRISHESETARCFRFLAVGGDHLPFLASLRSVLA